MWGIGSSAAVLLLLLAGLIHAQSAALQSEPPHLRRMTPIRVLGGFVENRGQWDREVRYFARRGGLDATLTSEALVLRPPPREGTGEWPAPLVLRWPRAEAVEGQVATKTAHHFLLAQGSATNARGFAQVVCRQVVSGIDLVVRTDGESFAYDLHVAPGADLATLRIDVEGALGQALIAPGVLALETAFGRIEQRIGASWELAEDGARVSVPSDFQLIPSAASASLAFGFEAPGRDPGREFVLDPSLVWSTYVGGSSQELVQDIAVTTDGSVYLAAKSTSSGPTTPGAFQPVKLGINDAWVGKLSADGSTLEWGTFLGGSDVEDAVGVTVNAEGQVIILGDTWSTDFPISTSGIQRTFAGLNDMFLACLTPDGSALSWSTFYGGAQNDHASAIALFSSGDILLAGQFDVPGPSATPGAYDTAFDTNDSVLARIAADGTHVVFQTYFDGGINEVVADDELGVVFAGSTDATLPATSGAFKTAMLPGDSGDGFVASINAVGSQLIWATFMGGAKPDTIYGMTIDAAGAIYVAGATDSNDFPATPGAFDSTSANDADNGWVAKLLPRGTGLVWSTYLSACCGGSTYQWDIDVDSAGNAISVGRSNEPNFPTTPDAFQPTYIGSFPSADAHLTKFDAFGETIVYSTYFGGGGTDTQTLIELDTEQDPVIALRSGSSTIPVTPGAYDISYGGGTDTVVAKFDLELLPWQVLGGALAGAIHTPNLAGGGKLQPGTPARLSVRGAAPSAPGALVAGLSAANLAFKGGTMVPPPSFILPLTTMAQGSLDLSFTWASLPVGISIWLQVWIKDTGAQKGFAATNALRMTSQ